MSGLEELKALISAQDMLVYESEDEFIDENSGVDTRSPEYHFEKIYDGCLEDYKETEKPFLYDFPRETSLTT